MIVGLTRLSLDVHWTTDVIGGWTVGLFVAAMSAALYEYLRRSAPPGVDLDAHAKTTPADAARKS